MEKFHNSPPVDPVVSITTPEIKKRLGSLVRASISVLVIGGILPTTSFAASIQADFYNKSNEVVSSASKNGVIFNSTDEQDQVNMFVNGQDFPAGATIQVYVVKHRSEWVLGDDFRDVTGSETEPDVDVFQLAPDATSFNQNVWSSSDDTPILDGNYDVVVRVGEDQEAVLKADDFVSTGSEASAVLDSLPEAEVDSIETQSIGNGAVRVGFDTNTIPRTLDGSYSTDIGFSINFFGKDYDKLYINNNGNLTFNNSNYQYWPSPLKSTGRKIIAPFWADADTRCNGSGTVKYGISNVNGFRAFGVTWENVRHYRCYRNTNKVNTFQVIIIERSDLGSGQFDIEFNYDNIQWQVSEDHVGNPARIGYSNGTNVHFELPGSGSGQLHNNAANALIASNLNSNVQGRYYFRLQHGSLELTSKYHYVREDNGTTKIKLKRTGGDNGAVSISYTLTEKSAKAGKDYSIKQQDILTWEHGDAEDKFIRIPLINDEKEEGDETFFLELTDVTGGATLGSLKKVKIRIADDECHGVYALTPQTINGIKLEPTQLHHPLIDVRNVDPITQQPSRDVLVYDGTFKLLNGTEDFIINIDQDLNYKEMIKGIDNNNIDIKDLGKQEKKIKCHATYFWNEKTFKMPYIDVPSVVILPLGKFRKGPTQVFEAKMQQMPLSGENGVGNYIFHVEGEPFYDASHTMDAEASVKAEQANDEDIDAGVKVDVDQNQYTYYKYLYTYDDYDGK
ncbi:nidogen-like domain-containing protein [Candidatus Marithrix sp. Canyon 246]|uniref:nidogen-like domain-containing protein n=1 Tax=Candidatus Marithrix sp. Canyon 246 TaxID=1827136 RepID=UPI000849FC7C|nr:nidogen-like domain-containing protein [Candidatus Marithrix sp. Canyon 246]